MRSSKMLFGKKLNNKGMSLVEVIVAITILGLVAVPVLHSLTTAMVYNAKARNRQEMTLTAESIMETFKGYDLDELKVRFSTGGAGIEGIRVADGMIPVFMTQIRIRVQVSIIHILPHRFRILWWGILTRFQSMT